MWTSMICSQMLSWANIQKLCTVGQRDLVNSAVAGTPRDEAKQSSFHCFVYSLLCCGSVCDQIKCIIAIGIFCFVQIQLMPDFFFYEEFRCKISVIWAWDRGPWFPLGRGSISWAFNNLNTEFVLGPGETLIKKSFPTFYLMFS